MITRIELIDQDGRVFVKYYQKPVVVKRVTQDSGKTLKLFVQPDTTINVNKVHKND